MDDPFDTAALRVAVLAAWAASPTRFREDANAEEDLRLGGYADAWFVELAQNAADAAGRGGRLRVGLADVPQAAAGGGPASSAGDPGAGSGGLGRVELRVANTGAALTEAGVAALASLRASAKRDDTGAVGRFGVGFAAVLAVSDEPRVVSTSGAVAFSAARTAEAIADLAGPAAELARRDAPPVLRLVWTSVEQPPAGFATEVRLPLRDGIDGAALLAHARSAAADLLLALPGLVEIEVEGHVVRREQRDGIVTVGARRWRVARGGGVLAAFDAAVEQRERREWAVTWALPLACALGDDVAHAPTATAEALSLPARLIATLPLEPDRRRVRMGPVTDAVLAGAAAAYVDLVRAVAPDERLALVPPPGFPRSPLDGLLRARIVDALRVAAWLPAPALERGAPAAAGWQEGDTAAVEWQEGDTAATRELTPGRAEWLDIPGLGARLPALLAAAGFDDLAAPPYLPAALTELGARRVTAAELVDRLFGVEQPPAWWRALYGELAEPVDVVPGLLDDLRALPVPLVDGRAAAGPATVLLPDGPIPPGLAVPGLHVADLGAVHPLLARLGATAADPSALLEHPALRAAVERSVDDAAAGLDTAPLAEAVLELLTAGAQPTEAPAALALPDVDGEPARADELMLPDAALRPLLADDVPLAVLHPDWAARFPREVLIAVGVLDGFAVVVDEEPVGPDHDLDDEDRWWHGLAEPPSRLVAVRDLDLVDATAWPAALALLAADRATREAATTGYTAWWLARHARLGGHRPGHWRLASAVPLAALYDPVPLACSPRHPDPPPPLAPTLPEGDPAATGLQEGAPPATGAPGPTPLAATTSPGSTPPAATPPAATPPAATPPAATPPAATPPAATPPAATPPAAVLRPPDPTPLACPTPPAARPPDPPPPDDALLAAIGVRRDLRIADAHAADDLLARLADPRRHPSAALVAAAHIALADAVAEGRVDAADLDLPAHVRAMDGTVVDVEVAAVLDAPWPAAVLAASEIVIGGDPVALAELLDLPLATEIVVGTVEGAGEPVRWAELGEVVVTCHTLGIDVPDGALRRHNALWVDLRRPTAGRHRVPVWREPDGTWHAEDPLRALLALLAE